MLFPMVNVVYLYTSTTQKKCVRWPLWLFPGFFDVVLARYIRTPHIPMKWYDEQPGYADPTLPIPTRTQHSIYCIVYVFFSKVLDINILNIMVVCCIFLTEDLNNGAIIKIRFCMGVPKNGRPRA
jgi:hypothetical protein